MTPLEQRAADFVTIYRSQSPEARAQAGIDQYGEGHWIAATFPPLVDEAVTIIEQLLEARQARDANGVPANERDL